MGHAWAWLRPPAISHLPDWPDHCGGPRQLVRAALCVPLFMSCDLCDGVCTRDLRQLVSFQLERFLLSPGQKQPQAFFP